MEYLELISVPTIAAVVYLVVNLLKYSLQKVKNYETFKQFIPLISAALGAMLGIVAYYAAPQIIAAGNVFVAILSGGASGLAATGCHQIYKQFFKQDAELEDNSDKDNNIESNVPKDNNKEN